MEFQWTVTLGQTLPFIATGVTIIGGAGMAWLVNRVKKALLIEWKKMVTEFKTETKEAIDDEVSDLQDAIADTNRRLTDLGVGVSELKTEVHAFKDHVTRHYVEKDEIAELRQSFDRSIERMQQSLDAAVGTMGDVRDAVLILTAKGGRSKPAVPAQRRPSRVAKAEQ